MSAKVLTKAAAKEAKIDILEDGRGTQAVHDVVLQCARRGVSARAKKKRKREVICSARNQGGKKEPVARVLVTNRRRSGAAAAWFLDRSLAIIPRKFRSQFDASLFKRR